jgi:hypothetical protein
MSQADELAARDAIRTSGMFNVLDLVEGDKVDFWMLTDEPFDRSRFRRRVREPALGFSFCVSTPEDTILAKLRWSRMTGESARTYTDALRVYEVQQGALDCDYIGRWAVMLEVGDLWERVQREALAG